ncbi:alpha/beta hydrolase [Aeromicrobium sp. IC_218]|uniref:alpha/beta hydrolase n=1 Tax=Aeromicrobium sp. IC_218 TaxID=2545468 RepID=UPI001038DAF1|nr:alpha/beta hydrolase [Aeromicrobium sp. IC_218]TCI96014.1 alpha/beta hydrolase [Aeromicrobium sp. IC_218]
MHLISERRLDDVVERRFTLGEIPGILWLPASASAAEPVPLVLAGQPGGFSLEQTHARMLARAGHAARAGLATITLELPGSGDRPRPSGVDEARAQVRASLTAGEPVGEDVIDRLVLPLVDRAVPEWQSLLDAVLDLPELTDRIACSGGVVSIAVRLAATDPRVRAAVLFAGSLVPRSILREARDVTVPVHVLLQWDDEHNDRARSLELFDALGSPEKTLNANLGGHTGVPAHAGAEATRFLVRHLGPSAAGGA